MSEQPVELRPVITRRTYDGATCRRFRERWKEYSIGSYMFRYFRKVGRLEHLVGLPADVFQALSFWWDNLQMPDAFLFQNFAMLIVKKYGHRLRSIRWATDCRRYQLNSKKTCPKPPPRVWAWARGGGGSF